MRKLVLLSVAFMGLLLFSCQRDDVSQIEDKSSDLVKYSSQIIEGKYIVMFEDFGLLKSASIGEKVTAAAVLQTSRDIFQSMNIPLRQPDFVYSTVIRGIAIEMTKSEADKLAAAPGVKGVYPDIMITLDLPKVQGKPAPAPKPQSTPWGISRVGGGVSGLGKTAWIIDTGIDLTHPDLTVDASRGVSYVPRITSPNDDNGHGTHCAGIVAAKNNDIGVIGVAAGATVVPVKVLDRRGSGSYSGVIAGVEWVANYAKPGDAANLSLGGPIYQDLDDALITLASKGVKVSIAAGNEGDNANNYSPSRVNAIGIYTVSAMNNTDTFASWSNYGNPPIDYCAPGVSIYSTYKGGTYATMSGTSMAAPHVCGLLLLGNISTSGYVNGDPDGTPDEIAHH